MCQNIIAVPVITWEEESNSLICYLNDTGGYRQLWATFTRNDKDGNITVGHCSRGSIQEHVHGGIIITFKRALDACVLELPRPIQQQYAGNYSCSLWVTKHDDESGSVLIASHGEVMVRQGTFQPNIYPVLVGVLGSVLCLLLVAFIMIFVACYRGRRRGKA